MTAANMPSSAVDLRRLPRTIRWRVQLGMLTVPAISVSTTTPPTDEAVRLLDDSSSSLPAATKKKTVEPLHRSLQSVTVAPSPRSDNATGCREGAATGTDPLSILLNDDGHQPSVLANGVAATTTTVPIASDPPTLFDGIISEDEDDDDDSDTAVAPPAATPIGSRPPPPVSVSATVSGGGDGSIRTILTPQDLVGRISGESSDGNHNLVRISDQYDRFVRLSETHMWKNSPLELTSRAGGANTTTTCADGEGDGETEDVSGRGAALLDGVEMGGKGDPLGDSSASEDPSHQPAAAAPATPILDPLSAFLLEAEEAEAAAAVAAAAEEEERKNKKSNGGGQRHQPAVSTTPPRSKVSPPRSSPSTPPDNAWKEFYTNREMIDLIYKDLNRLPPRLVWHNDHTDRKRTEAGISSDGRRRQHQQQNGDGGATASTPQRHPLASTSDGVDEDEDEEEVSSVASSSAGSYGATGATAADESGDDSSGTGIIPASPPSHHARRRRRKQRDALQRRERDERLKLLSDVLFLYSKEHPDVGYRQGMHEILAHVVLALERDYDLLLLVRKTKIPAVQTEEENANADGVPHPEAVLAPSSPPPSTEAVAEAIGGAEYGFGEEEGGEDHLVTVPLSESETEDGQKDCRASAEEGDGLSLDGAEHLLQRENLRADAYLLFEAWMDQLKFAYQDNSSSGGGATSPSSSASFGTEAMGRRILALLRHSSSEVYDLISQISDNMGAPPQLYCAKWIRLLFSREFTTLELVLELWDVMLDVIWDPKRHLWCNSGIDGSRAWPSSSPAAKIERTELSITLMDVAECAACGMVLLQSSVLLTGKHGAQYDDYDSHDATTMMMHDCLTVLMNYPTMSSIEELQEATFIVARHLMERRLGIAAKTPTTAGVAGFGAGNDGTGNDMATAVASSQQHAYHNQHSGAGEAPFQQHEHPPSHLVGDSGGGMAQPIGYRDHGAVLGQNQFRGRYTDNDVSAAGGGQHHAQQRPNDRYPSHHQQHGNLRGYQNHGGGVGPGSRHQQQNPYPSLSHHYQHQQNRPPPFNFGQTNLFSRAGDLFDAAKVSVQNTLATLDHHLTNEIPPAAQQHNYHQSPHHFQRPVVVPQTDYHDGTAVSEQRRSTQQARMPAVSSSPLSYSIPQVNHPHASDIEQQHHQQQGQIAQRATALEGKDRGKDDGTKPVVHAQQLRDITKEMEASLKVLRDRLIPDATPRPGTSHGGNAAVETSAIGGSLEKIALPHTDRGNDDKDISIASSGRPPPPVDDDVLTALLQLEEAHRALSSLAL